MLANRLARDEKRKSRAAEKAAEASAWLKEWNKWMAAIDLPSVILDALCMPREAGEAAAFEYMRSLTRPRVTELLERARLGGLTDLLMQGIEKLHAQSAPSGGALNEKFQQSGKFMMGYGSLDVFFGGLEQLLGPPQMVKDPERCLASGAKTAAAARRCGYSASAHRELDRQPRRHCAAVTQPLPVPVPVC